MATKKVNYLNNKDMLKEIHASKSSFCSFDDDIYANYHYIFDNIGKLDFTYKTEIDEETGQQIEVKEPVFIRLNEEELYQKLTSPNILKKAKQNYANSLRDKRYNEALNAEDNDQNSKKNQPKLNSFAVNPDTIKTEDLVFRVLTYEHIPSETERKKTHKTVADWHVKLNFVPFKHYVIRDNKLVEVGRSHWHNGQFSLTHGTITDKLAKMYLLLVKRYSEKANWRGYSYISEMKGCALLQLSEMGLRFEESKSSNPFSYFTQIITNSFTKILNSEKDTQRLRDKLLVSQGQLPSYSYQLEHEEEIRKLREEDTDE